MSESKKGRGVRLSFDEKINRLTDELTTYESQLKSYRSKIDETKAKISSLVASEIKQINSNDSLTSDEKVSKTNSYLKYL